MIFAQFTTTARNYAALLGRRGASRLVGGLAVAVLIFSVELAFAYLLQSFLARMGAVQPALPSLFGSRTYVRARFVIPLLFGVGLLKTAFGMMHTYLQGAVVEEFRTRQRSRILEWSFHSESVSGSEVNLLFNERVPSAAMAVESIQQATVLGTVCLLFFVFLLRLSPLTTFPVVLLLLLFMFPAKALHRKIKALGRSVTAEWTHTNARLQMSIKNLLLLHIYGTQDLELAKAQGSLGQYCASMLRYYRYSGLVNAVTHTAGVGVLCILAVLMFVYEDRMPAALKLSYLYIFYRFVQGANQWANQISVVTLHWHNVTELGRWWNRVKPTQRPDARSVTPQTQALRSAKISGPIGWDLQQVSFGYAGGQTNLIDRLDLHIASGTMVAITGPSGVGKSTILGMLLGALVPSAGRIDVELDGERQNLQEFRASVLKSIGYVGSEPYMIEGTIRQNLAYGLDSSPGDDEIADALARAQCDFLNDLPERLNHVLTEQGQGLSSGQKQRLSLARALLRKPKALILDEATSNLDVETELKLIEIFRQLRGEVTIIAATHRAALAEIADQTLDLKVKDPRELENRGL